MRISIAGRNVEFFINESASCCGENRADWKKVGEINLERLIKGIMEAVSSNKTVRLDA